MSNESTKEKGVIARAVNRLELDIDSTVLRPHDLMAQLMDLRGSVAISDFLSEPGVPPDAQPSHPAAVRAMAASVFEDVRESLAFSIENAYRPRYRLPTAARAWAILKRTHVLESYKRGSQVDRKAALRSAARLIWAPFSEFIETRLKRARFALRDLREELTGPLTGLGDAAAEVERLDYLLRTAIEAETTKLYLRIGHWANLEFTKALAEALNELPQVADSDAFAIGFNEAGWLGTIFGDAMDLVVSVTEHEISQIINLIENAIGASDS
ncbi:MAG: hypothetical protein VYA30_08405 [Myxococcota bacterium]|nr:hypothetical protein [Myxococcota bacterium]